MTFRQGIFGQVTAALAAMSLWSGCDPLAAGTATDDEASTSGASTGGATTDSPTTTIMTTTNDTLSSTTDDTGPEPPLAYDEWLTIPLPGAVCGNGSEYKIFANFHEGAKDLLIMLEPGGACWDYDTCTGNAGPLGAAHPDGIPDNLMYDPLTKNLSPLMRRDNPDGGITEDWNMVFIPYCTGDVHTGNNVITNSDPNGVKPDIEFHHNGHNNIIAATEWMAKQFPTNDRLFVTGCSAGGAGAIINYHFFRTGITAERGYMMDDSGPIFPSGGHSAPLHSMIRSSWNVDSVLGELPEGFDITDDFGVLNAHVADLYPEDRLSTVFFQRDYNYSRYSYERFFPDMTKDKTLTYWMEDTDLLEKLYTDHDNLAYYLPYWRGLNDSHCVSIISYLDTDIEESNVTLEDFIDVLLDDSKPLMSYRESIQPDEDN
jgi:hypothetical protein